MLKLELTIENYITFKESLGFSRSSFEGVLYEFKKYVFNNYPNCEVLSEEVILNWCRQRDTENPSGYRTRIVPLNVFLKYLSACGLECYVLPPNFMPKVVRYTPYIFNDDELLSLFHTFSSTAACCKFPMRHRIIAVVYRLIYFCGLRPNEGRELHRSDVDLENGVLFIRKNKAHKERYVPMSEDVTAMCTEYADQLDKVYPRSEYFFPTPDDEPYDHHWLTRTFRNCWRKTRGDAPRVRPYDMRHRFATAALMKWINEGIEIYVKFPYLREYMGHENLSDTLYYVHLLPENLVRSAAIDWDRFNSLIPEVPDYD